MKKEGKVQDEMRWGQIRYLVLDVDGTMTDGGIYLDSQGQEMKKFSVKDGAAILLARQAGIETVILTGRESLCVTKRAQELAIPYVFQNVKQKELFFREFFSRENRKPFEAAYLGDDLNDLPAMKLAGISACPKDAADEVRDFCSLVLSSMGGQGAVREFVDLLLRKRGILQSCAERLWG